MTELFDGFDEVNLGDGDWQTLGENLYTLKRNGISVPLGDAILATTAQKYGVPVWSRDKHFQMMKDVLGFELYEEEDWINRERLIGTNPESPPRAVESFRLYLLRNNLPVRDFVIPRNIIYVSPKELLKNNFLFLRSHNIIPFA